LNLIHYLLLILLFQVILPLKILPVQAEAAAEKENQGKEKLDALEPLGKLCKRDYLRLFLLLVFLDLLDFLLGRVFLLGPFGTRPFRIAVAKLGYSFKLAVVKRGRWL